MGNDQCTKYECNSDFNHLPNFGEEQTKEFLYKASHDINSDEHKMLYRHLVRCFCDADVNYDGKINPDEFSGLIKVAAKLPRLYGWAKNEEDMFNNEEEKKLSREEYFKRMDRDLNGNITLDEFLKDAFEHIKEKITILKKEEKKKKKSDEKKYPFLADS